MGVLVYHKRIGGKLFWIKKMSQISISLNRVVQQSLSAATEGRLEDLKRLLTPQVARYFRTDKQAALLRVAIQHHQTAVFDFVLQYVPPKDPWAGVVAMSTAIRCGYIHAAQPLIDFVSHNEIPRMISDSVVTKQQDFFNVLFPYTCDNIEPIQIMLQVSEYKHTHDLGGLFEQWKDEWWAIQQRNTIVAALEPTTVVAPGRKI